MIGSDSEHEFPRCDGHVGRILRNNRCKNRSEMKQCSVTEWVALTGGNLFSTNVLIIASCSFDSNHPYNPQVSSVWRHFCRDIHRDYGCKILSPG
uniref:Uncharacterized protein n=1 Tax=Escherichia coli TaxID=562 RepID=A0A8F1IFP0_ECOLX|nr:hypothetical protein EOLPNHPH_00098 [Escherichia coli]